MKISKKAAVGQGSMGFIFLFMLFSFYIYAYGVASALIQNKHINPVTGEIYNIGDIVAVS